MPVSTQAPSIRATDLHRVFIQSLLSRRAMRDEVALELYKRAIGACQSYDGDIQITHPTTTGGLNAFLEDVSTLLHDVGMEVKRGKEETGRGKGWVVLVNNDPTEVALQATDYPSLDIDYYRRVIEAIMTSYPANSISHNQALSLVSDLTTHMTRSAAESLLSSLVSRGWLNKSRRGRYSLGVRAVLELDPYLRAEYEDYIQMCKQCKRIGVACPNVDCDAHWHGYCYEAHLRIPRASCEDCGTPHTGVAGRPVGEKAVSTTEDGFRRGLKKRKRPNGEGSRSQRRANDGEDGDGTEEDDEDVELEMEEAMSMEQSGSGFVDRGAGPSGWRVDSTSRRKSVVPETQYEEDQADGEGTQVQEESEETRPARRRRSMR